MIPVVDSVTCTGCGACVEICPPGAINLEEQTAHLDQEFCEECGFCVAECPTGALKIIFPIKNG